MNIDNVNKWLTLLANFGVVAGIVFLGIEVRQNQVILEDTYRLNRVEARMADVDTFNDLRAQWLQNEELTRIWIDGKDGKELTVIENARFENLCTSDLWTFLKIFERSFALGDMTTADSSAKMVRNTINEKPGIARCWQGVRQAMLAYGAERFVVAVDNDGL
jgi:hypothetical protein